MTAPRNPLPIADVLNAVETHGASAFEFLVGRGQPEKRVWKKMQELVDKGYLECGVSAVRPWLTEKGKLVIAK